MNNHEKMNILMVDDQPAKLLSYEAILHELDENLIKASSGKEALEQLLKKDIAIVLMDVSMPDLDGFELAEMIRQHPRFQKTAIIFISAVHLTDVDRIKGYQRGAVDYISVPVIPELLRAKVSVFADLHRKTRQLEVLNRELRNLSGRLLTMQDEERRRFARELHDGLGQELTAAKMIVDALHSHDYPALAREELAQASSLIEGAIQQVRSLSHLMHPPLLDEIGLRAALLWYSEGLSKRSGIATSVELYPDDFPRFSKDIETAVFRIVQETLTNVLRHSGARKCWVSVANKDEQVLITVRDDGKGVPDGILEFRPESIGIGIAGIRQRVKEFGGSLRIKNVNASGTLVEVAIPINRDNSETPRPALASPPGIALRSN
jgi:signal transduction histidine kinase